MGISLFNIGIAFVGGLLSFLSPCVLPLVPGYISLMSGVSVDHLKQGSEVEAQPRPKLGGFSPHRLVNWTGQMVEWFLKRFVQWLVTNRPVIFNSLAFNAGLSVIFLALGATAGFVGSQIIS